MVLPLVTSLGGRRERDERAGRHTTPTINDVDPIRHLGVHPAVLPIGGQAGLPALTAYVERPHDERLRVALATDGRNSVLLVVGGSSTGKTRACYEAIRAVLPDDPLLRPADGEELLALLRADLESPTIVWLDEAQRFFDRRHGGDVARALHLLLDTTPRPGLKRMVIGSMWSGEIWSSDDDDGQAVRELLARPGIAVPVCEAFPAPEHVARAAQRDPRWRDALVASDGVNVVPFLSGGPLLVRDLEKGLYGSDAGALLNAAMDGHRIGLWSPLPLAVLEAAASGYRGLQQDPIAVSQAVADAMRPVCGVRALTRAEGHDDAAVVLHGYLAQHARGPRRREPIPDSLWAAVTSGVDDDGDIDRVIDSALDRGLVQWGVILLRRRSDAGDGTAARRLAELLHARGDADAVDELRVRAGDGCPHATDLLLERSDPMAEAVLRARADAGDRTAAVHLVELLFERGGPDARAWLRDRADNGDLAAARRLAELLFHDGGHEAVDELRIRADDGDSHAAALLVELLAGWRDADAVAELRTRADDGDADAAARLVEVLFERGGVEEVAELRKRADNGDLFSAEHLVQLLYRQGDEPAATELRQRAAGGDPSAARVLVRMLYARGDQDACAELRERTRAGDRFAGEQLVELLCRQGGPESLHELRVRADAGDGYAATLLVELLVERGDHDAVVDLRALSETGVHYATELLVAMGDPETARAVRTRACGGDSAAIDLAVERLVDPGDPAAVAELQTYAAAGSGYAVELLIRVLFNLGDEGAVTALRAYAEDGNDFAAALLVRLLFDHGDQKSVEELRARSQAGDRFAGQQLVDLLAGRQDPEAVAELRIRAEGGDWYAGRQLAGMLAENGDTAATAELRARSRAGDRYASERLVELLVERGDPEAVSELQGRADIGDRGAAQALAHLLLQRGDEQGLRAEINAGNTPDAAYALATLLEGRRTHGPIRCTRAPAGSRS